MNILIKTLINSKRVQDTAGIIRGAFRILQSYPINPSKSLYEIDNNSLSKNSQSTTKDFKIKDSLVNEKKEKDSQAKSQASVINEVINENKETTETNKNKDTPPQTTNTQAFTIESDNFINVNKEGESDGMKIYTESKSKMK